MWLATVTVYVGVVSMLTAGGIVIGPTGVVSDSGPGGVSVAIGSEVTAVGSEVAAVEVPPALVAVARTSICAPTSLGATT
jgi:hypothetical protein